MEFIQHSLVPTCLLLDRKIMDPLNYFHHLSFVKKLKLILYQITDFSLSHSQELDNHVMEQTQFAAHVCLSNQIFFFQNVKQSLAVCSRRNTADIKSVLSEDSF